MKERKKKMSKSKEKILATTLAILMIISLATIFSAVAPVKATYVSAIGNTPTTTQGYPSALTTSPPAGVTPGTTIVTVPYLSFSPLTIGMGQTLLVNVWSSPGSYHAFPMVDYQVNIIKPDGTTMTVGPFNSYCGDFTAWFTLIPDQVGTWQFQFVNGGTYIPVGQYWDAPGSLTGGFIATSQFINIGSSIYYTPTSTGWQNLTVTQNGVNSWPPTPASVMGDYWTRPLNPMWRDLASNIGDFPFDGAYYFADGHVLYPDTATKYKYTPWVQAPNTAHILWDRTLDTTGPAGMVGGYTYQYSLAPSAGTPQIIYAGRAYQTISTYIDNGSLVNMLECYDLRTGDVYWKTPVLANIVPGAFGIGTAIQYIAPSIIEYQAPTDSSLPSGASIARDTNADAGYNIALIAFAGNSIYKFSPATGQMTGNYSIFAGAGTSIGTPTYTQPGYALMVETITTGSGASAVSTYRLINFTTWGTANTLAARMVSNITWPQSTIYGGTTAIGGGGGALDIENGLAASVGWNTPPGPQWGIGTEIYVTDLTTGNVLWHLTTNNSVTENIQSTSSPVFWHGNLAINAHGRSWICFNGRTGAVVWTSDQTEYPWGAWWPYSTDTYVYNSTSAAIIVPTYEGIYAINWADGKILWHYSTENTYVPFETPYNADPFFSGVELADGKVYAYNTEHTPTYPRTRSWSTYCINATDGTLLWKMYNPMVEGAIADGYLTAANTYDGKMYVFGKGQSSTAITGPQTTVPLGQAVLIQGNVMDQSPGQPNTPAVSVGSMVLEMEHIHMAMPITGLWGNETITGVPLTLTAIASDGTVTNIGTTTTNGYYGTFGTTWTPTKEGVYTILASFAGDDSYGSSTAATSISVGPAPTAAPTAAPTSTPLTASDITNSLMTYLVAGIVAIIIVIVIVGVLILRKK